MKKLFVFFAAVTLALPAPALALAGPAAQERIDSGRRLAREGSPDFAFLEYQASLRLEPDAAQRREATFAVGEYHFRDRNPGPSREAFEETAADPKGGLYRLIALAHLSKLARGEGDGSAADAYDERLKETLSSRKLVLVFEDKKTKRWTSPLGARFQVGESVDRLEILLDGEPFYSATLP